MLVLVDTLLKSALLKASWMVLVDIPVASVRLVLMHKEVVVAVVVVEEEVVVEVQNNLVGVRHHLMMN